MWAGSNQLPRSPKAIAVSAIGGVMPARLLVAVCVAAATVAVLALFGIGFTSALIELVVFLAGLAVWVRAGPPARRSEARVQGVVSRRGGVRVRQRGPKTLARRIFAREDVTIEQEDGRGY